VISTIVLSSWWSPPLFPSKWSPLWHGDLHHCFCLVISTLARDFGDTHHPELHSIEWTSPGLSLYPSIPGSSPPHFAATSPLEHGIGWPSPAQPGSTRFHTWLRLHLTYAWSMDALQPHEPMTHPPCASPAHNMMHSHLHRILHNSWHQHVHHPPTTWCTHTRTASCTTHDSNTCITRPQHDALTTALHLAQLMTSTCASSSSRHMHLHYVVACCKSCLRPLVSLIAHG
jgi:hypothetical protein